MEEKKFDEMPESERNQCFDECFAYDEELKRKGHYIGGEALDYARTAKTLRYKQGKISATDGPFTETKEQLGGILLLEAENLDHAVALMSKHPGMKMGSIFEIRPSFDMSPIMKESEERRSAK
jgi:hypothetical protein